MKLRKTERPISTRQYARLVSIWVESIGLDPRRYGTHSISRTKAVLIYMETGNLRAVQLLLGHSKLESAVKYLGIEVDELMALCDRLEAARAEREATRDRLAAASLARLNAPDPDPGTFQSNAAFALDNLAHLISRPDQINSCTVTLQLRQG